MREKIRSKIAKKSASPIFTATMNFLSFLSLHRGLQPPTLSPLALPPPSLPQVATQPPHLMSAPLSSSLSLSLSPLCKPYSSSSNNQLDVI